MKILWEPSDIKEGMRLRNRDTKEYIVAAYNFSDGNGYTYILVRLDGLFPCGLQGRKADEMAKLLTNLELSLS